MNTATGPIFNVRLRKVGGIWFLTLGRVHFSFCVSRQPTNLETNQ